MLIFPDGGQLGTDEEISIRHVRRLFTGGKKAS